MSTLFRPNLVLVLLALHGCATEPPAYVPPSAPPRHHEPLNMDTDAPASTAQGQTTGVRGMSYEELLACGHDKANITAKEKKLHAQLGGIDALKKAIDGEGAAIESSRRLVDAHSQKSVDGYNDRVHKYQATVRSLNEDVASYNKSVEELGTEARAYGIACNNRPYRESDRERLPDNLRELIGKDSKPVDLPVVFDDDGHQTTHIAP